MAIKSLLDISNEMQKSPRKEYMLWVEGSNDGGKA